MSTLITTVSARAALATDLCQHGRQIGHKLKMGKMLKAIHASAHTIPKHERLGWNEVARRMVGTSGGIGLGVVGRVVAWLVGWGGVRLGAR